MTTLLESIDKVLAEYDEWKAREGLTEDFGPFIELRAAAEKERKLELGRLEALHKERQRFSLFLVFLVVGLGGLALSFPPIAAALFGISDAPGILGLIGGAWFLFWVSTAPRIWIKG